MRIDGVVGPVELCRATWVTFGPAGGGSPAQSGASAAGQTDTEWGRIWDTLPSTFPQIPGAHPAEEAATGPASATLAIEGNVSRLVATALVGLLSKNGFPTARLGTPLKPAVTPSKPLAPRQAARSRRRSSRWAARPS